MLAFSGRFCITCLDQNGFLSTFFYIFSSTDHYEVRQSKKHQYVILYQNWNRTPVYLELAVNASYFIGHLRAPSVLIRLLCMVGRQNRAGWCWAVGSRRNDAMSATYCLPLPAQHHFHKTDCTLISVYLPFSPSIVPCLLAKLFHVFIKVVAWKVLIYNACIIQGGFFNWSALKMTKCQTLRKFSHLELFRRELQVIWHIVIF